MSSLKRAEEIVELFHGTFVCPGCGKRFVLRWKGKESYCVLCDHVDEEFEKAKRKNLRNLSDWGDDD